MWAQVVLAAAAWWVLASVASSLIRDRRLSIALRVVVLMLGLAAPVVSWNSLLLSESVAISLTALLIAAWIRYSRAPRWQTAATALTVTLFWTFTRQPHVLLCGLIAVVAVVAWARASDSRRLKAVVASTLIAIAVAGFVEINRNQSISRTNVGSIIQNRILLNKGWTKWFVAHGMPYSPSIAKYAGVPFHYQHENTQYFDWIDTDGTSTYLRFVLTHPRYTLLDPLPYFPGEEASLQHPNKSQFKTLEPNPTPSLLSPVVNYGRHRNLLPSVVDRLLFDQGEIGDILLLVAAAGALFWAGRTRTTDRGLLLVPALVVVSAVPQGYLVWLGRRRGGGRLTGSRWSPPSRCESDSGSCSRSPPTGRLLPGIPPRCAHPPLQSLDSFRRRHPGSTLQARAGDARVRAARARVAVGLHRTASRDDARIARDLRASPARLRRRALADGGKDIRSDARVVRAHARSRSDAAAGSSPAPRGAGMSSSPTGIRSPPGSRRSSGR